MTSSPGLQESTRSANKTTSLCLGTLPGSTCSGDSWTVSFWKFLYTVFSESILKFLLLHVKHSPNSVFSVADMKIGPILSPHFVHINIIFFICGFIPDLLVTIPLIVTNFPTYWFLNSLIPSSIGNWWILTKKSSSLLGRADMNCGYL